MDIDMHYYGTYALARAAGLRRDAARLVATAAEFVDDSTRTDVIAHPSGARFRGEPTAHHPTALAPINDPDDQLQVWVPFHFLPGNAGTTLSQRLMCTKDSVLAREMVHDHLERADAFYGLELLGIAAHVHADTFAHYGFSGVSSRVNRIEPESLKAQNADGALSDSLPAFFAKHSAQGGLLQNFRSFIVEVESVIGGKLSGALGHGAAAVFPDQPYLDWSYTYEMPEIAGVAEVGRQNVRDYEQAAEALHGLFARFVAASPFWKDGKGGRDFDDVRDDVRRIVGRAGDRATRIAAWRQAVNEGRFGRDAGENLPAYDPEDWRAQTAGLASLPDAQAATQIPAYRFHFAAALHRHYVLRHLLPRHGLHIV